MNIEHSTAVVSGGSSGIGRSLIIELARRGARVVPLARRGDRLEELADLVRGSGGKILPIVCDVTDRSAFERAIDATVEHFGSIDILVNNAGRGCYAYVDDTGDAAIEEVFRLNVFPLWYGTSRALRYMRQQRRGLVLTIASLAGKIGYPANAPYVAAKHAAVGFTRALRTELVDSGVVASVVVPGGTLTDWANSTMGGPMTELFAYENRRGRELAEESESGNDPLPTIDLLDPDTVARRIVDQLEDPPPEIYTHDGSRDLVRRFQTDQVGVEALLSPYWRASLEFGRGGKPKSPSTNV